MPKVALDFAPAFVGEQLRPLLAAGVDFDAMRAHTDEELARCAHNADVLVSTRTHIDARTLGLIPSVRLSGPDCNCRGRYAGGQQRGILRDLRR